MNILDGLTKQLNGRGLQGKTVLEGVVWLSDLHKNLSGFYDGVKNFAENPACSTDAILAWLQKTHDTAKALWLHLGADAAVLKLLTEVSGKRKPEDTDVEIRGAPFYMDQKDTQRLLGIATTLEKKVLECGLREDAWKESGTHDHIVQILDSIHGVKTVLEKLAGPDRISEKTLDDKLFEIHFGATAHIGNRHFEDRAESPGLIKAIAGLVKRMKRELVVIKAEA